MINKTIIFAILIYLGNSFANVFSGIFSKFAFLKLGSSSIPVFSLLLLRAIISITILSPFFIKNVKYVKKSFNYNIVIAVLTAMDVFLFNLGLKGTPINQAVIIMFLIPIWTNIFSKIILKEKGSAIQNYIILLCCFIALFISNQELNPYYIYKNYKDSDPTSFNFYPFFIFINTFCVTFGLILQKKIKQDRPIMYGLFFNNLALFFISLLFFDTSFFSYLNKYTILIAFVLSILDILEFGCAYKAYSMCNVSILQPIRFTRIAISAIFGYFLLQEKTTLNQIVGMSIIIFINFLNPILNSIKKNEAKK